MPRSRLNKMKEKIGSKEIPTKISDFCIGECDVEVFGIDEETKRPKVYCNGCGRNMGR